MTQDRSVSFEVPGSLILALEKLQTALGAHSVSQIAHDAILWYLGVRSAAATRDLGRLTRRQLEVLTLTVQGRTTKEAAEQLGISVKTVETYRTQFMNTLQFKNVADAVRFAIGAGILAPYP
jgi:DNA-binding NarL/FixJ family response regulator